VDTCLCLLDCVVLIPLTVMLPPAFQGTCVHSRGREECLFACALSRSSRYAFPVCGVRFLHTSPWCLVLFSVDPRPLLTSPPCTCVLCCCSSSLLSSPYVDRVSVQSQKDQRFTWDSVCCACECVILCVIYACICGVRMLMDDLVKLSSPKNKKHKKTDLLLLCTCE
jgi:hypothetical protein